EPPSGPGRFPAGSRSGAAGVRMRCSDHGAGELDYPTAAALSFILMAIVLIMVTIYIRRAGTEDLV
ncbi:hypothetical protein ACWDA9_26220, partial [Streptomyces sp. NPDC001193]